MGKFHTKLFITFILLNFLVDSMNAKIILDNDENDKIYGNIMRERYRNKCLKNLEETFSTWKIFFKSVESYCEYAVQKAGAQGAFIRRGPPNRPLDDCFYLETCDDYLPAI
uniref:CSON009411 protein n=1 Tax=Culicoides sonorensis TaxID=179676 RepID=A0A336N307_CULSO